MSSATPDIVPCRPPVCPPQAAKKWRSKSLSLATRVEELGEMHSGLSAAAAAFQSAGTTRRKRRQRRSLKRMDAMKTGWRCGVALSTDALDEAVLEELHARWVHPPRVDDISAEGANLRRQPSLERWC